MIIQIYIYISHKLLWLMPIRYKQARFENVQSAYIGSCNRSMHSLIVNSLKN